MKTAAIRLSQSATLFKFPRQAACPLLGAFLLSFAFISNTSAAASGAAGQATNGPPALGMSISVYHNQQHFAYLDASGDIEDAFFDGSHWHPQRINNVG